MTLVTHHEDSHLGAWTQVTWRPRHLAGLVESIWFFAGVTAHRRERHFPTGTLDLIVQLGGPDELFRIIEGEPAGTTPVASIGGQLVGPLVIEAPPRPCRVLGVRLTPAGAFALLGLPLHELTGLTVDLRDIVGAAEADELAERCGDAVAHEDRVLIAERWIAGRISRSRGVDPCIARAAAEIECESGRSKVGTLPGRLGISRSRLVAGFNEQIGVTPKLFARIVRFRGLAAALRSDPAPLVELALSRGYYDQPHLNAEFRKLSGLTPRAYVAATRYPEATSIAE